MFLHAEIKGTAGYCSSKRKRSTLVSKELGMRSRLTEFVTFLKFPRLFGSHTLLQIWKTSIHRDGDAINANGGGDGGDDVAGDVGGDVGGSKIRPRPLCSVLCQPGWGGDHAPAAWETLDLQSRLQREHSFWKWPAHNASRLIFQQRWYRWQDFVSGIT